MDKKYFRRCALCKNRYSLKTTKFFKVPLGDIKRDRWIASCKVNLRAQDIICEHHFRPKDYVNGPRCSSGQTRLQPGAVPKITEKLTDPLSNDPSQVPMELVSDASHKDCTTQTKDDFLQQSFRVEIMLIKQKYEQLEKEHVKLIAESTVLHSSLSKIFTKGQIDKLKNPNKKIMWSSEDILNARDLLTCGIKAYKHIYSKCLPLPHIMTLRKWAKDKRINTDDAESAELATEDANTTSNTAKRDLSVLYSDDIVVEDTASDDDALKQSDQPTEEKNSTQSIDQKKQAEYDTFGSNGYVAKGGDMPDLSCDDIVVLADVSAYATYDSSKDTTLQYNSHKLENRPALHFSQRVGEDDTSLTNLLKHDKVSILNHENLKVRQDAMTSLSKLPKHINVSILSANGRKDQQTAILPLNPLPKLTKHNKRLSLDCNKDQQNASLQSKQHNLQKMPALLNEFIEDQESRTSFSSSPKIKKGCVLSTDEINVENTASKDATLLSTSPKQDKVSILYIDVPKKQEHVLNAATSPRNIMKEIKVSVTLDDIMQEAYEFDLFNF